MKKRSSFSHLSRTKRKKRRGREKDFPLSFTAPPPPPTVFPAHVSFHRPYYMNAWSRYKKERRENNYCLIQGSRAERHTKTQVIKRLASPHTSFGVRSSRIHFSPTNPGSLLISPVGERWMRDERTSKDVWGEAIKRYAGIRLKQSRAVNPQRLQILRIDREGMTRHDVICAKKKLVKKMSLEL